MHHILILFEHAIQSPKFLFPRWDEKLSPDKFSEFLHRRFFSFLFSRKIPLSMPRAPVTSLKHGAGVKRFDKKLFCDTLPSLCSEHSFQFAWKLPNKPGVTFLYYLLKKKRCPFRLFMRKCLSQIFSSL